MNNLNELIGEMKEYVIECLVEDYNQGEKYAANIVEQSNFYKFLVSDPNYVMHYSVEYWAEDVANQYGISKLSCSVC
jgi:hypothetical protein